MISEVTCFWHPVTETRRGGTAPAVGLRVTHARDARTLRAGALGVSEDGPLSHSHVEVAELVAFVSKLVIPGGSGMGSTRILPPLLLLLLLLGCFSASWASGEVRTFRFPRSAAYQSNDATRFVKSTASVLCFKG